MSDRTRTGLGRRLVAFVWTYKADEFLKLPAYGRDYPPARP
jgi:hypothetical protein